MTVPGRNRIIIFLLGGGGGGGGGGGELQWVREEGGTNILESVNYCINSVYTYELHICREASPAPPPPVSGIHAIVNSFKMSSPPS